MRKINREMTILELRLQRVANKLGLSDWRELEKII